MPTTTRRHAILVVLLVISAALLMSACMWGVVTNTDTGSGVSGATVTFTDSNGHTGSTTSGAGGLYFFDSATGPIPSIGSVDIEVSAPGFATLTTTRDVDYGDNPHETLSNLSSFWEVQSFEIVPETVVGDILTRASGIDFPTGVAYDKSGNIYFSERDTCRVRRFNASSGSITTIAGNGTCGFSGDGGPATDAELGNISGLALDGAGHLAVAINSAGDCRVREIDLSSHVITTVAGNGTCGFAGDGGPATDAELGLADNVVPSIFVWSDVAFDSSGNLYIADIFNCRIREVSGGTITTIAGSGATGFTCGGFSGDGGPATAARLNQPSSVGVDQHGNVFIAELGGCRVRKITPPSAAAGGMISTIAGTGTCTPSGDGGPAVDAGLANVRGLAVDHNGDIFISAFAFSVDNTTTPRYCEVRRIDVSTGDIDAVAGTGTCGDSGDGGPATSAHINSPGDIALACNGDVAFSEALNGDIRVVLGVNNGGDRNVCD